MKARNVLTVAAGAAIVLLALWLGTYCVHSLPDNHWAVFPTFVTAFLASFVGLVVMLSKVP